MNRKLMLLNGVLALVVVYGGVQLYDQYKSAKAREAAQRWNWNPDLLIDVADYAHVVAGPGTLTTFGEALREPCGRIHWSGTETATEWMGYLDGAIQSGQRAAEEVATRLS